MENNDGIEGLDVANLDLDAPIQDENLVEDQEIEDRDEDLVQEQVGEETLGDHDMI